MNDNAYRDIFLPLEDKFTDEDFPDYWTREQRAIKTLQVAARKAKDIVMREIILQHKKRGNGGNRPTSARTGTE